MSDLAMIPADWSPVAEDDTSEGYEVDIQAIYRKPDNTLALVSASGCSCWDGGYSLDGEFNSLELMALAVFGTGGECQKWPGSIRRYLRLFAAALAALDPER